MPVMMGRPCTCCEHPSRSELDAAIAAGAVVRKLADKYGLSRQAIMRHRDRHMAREIKEGGARRAEAESAERGDGLLDQVIGLQREAQTILEQSKRRRDSRTSLAALRELARIVELQGKLLGNIGTGGDTNVTINVNHYRQLQVGIVAALEPFPQAKAAVLAALGDA